MTGVTSADRKALAASILEPGGGAGLRAALEALELACAMLMEQLRRENPDATSQQLEGLFLQHMAARPLDGPGLRRSFPLPGAGA